jgi:hypothetical protein
MRLFRIIVVVLGVVILFFGMSATYVFFSQPGAPVWHAVVTLGLGILVLVIGCSLWRRA